jgi:hypothetical protein
MGVCAFFFTVQRHREIFSISDSKLSTPSPSPSTHTNNSTMNKFLLTLLAIPNTTSFTPTIQRRTSIATNAVLEGREIEGALAPTNNFILVKKAAVEDQTTGGILLTGSVGRLLDLSWMVV